ncbi:MAG TPA: hypothetical protein VI455_02385 [Terriglobia bacterium]
MDVEKTIEFLLKNQGRLNPRFNAKFDRAEERFRKSEARIHQPNRVRQTVQAPLAYLDRVDFS